MPCSGSIVDPNEAFIDRVCKDPIKTKTVDKNKLVHMTVIHIYVCVLDSLTERDEEGKKQWGGQNNVFSQIREA